MNSKQLAQMMKRFGINVKNIDNVEKVIIQTDTKEYVFDSAEVTVMEAQGQKTYQVIGEPIVKNRGGEPQDTQKEDIKLIMEQTGRSEEDARKALQETNGDLAEAILKLSQKWDVFFWEYDIIYWCDKKVEPRRPSVFACDTRVVSDGFSSQIRPMAQIHWNQGQIWGEGQQGEHGNDRDGRRVF